MSIASEFAVSLTARIQQIRKTNGFETDIGAHVFRGRRVPDEDKIPCVVLVEGEDEVLSQHPGVACLSQTYHFEGHVLCDADHPNDAAHAVIADLKKAIFSNRDDILSPEIDYAGRFISVREDGLAIVSAGISVRVRYSERLAQP